MTRIRILIVDDEPEELAACARAVVEILPEAEILTEKRSVRAQEMLRRDSFDLLISDLKMPMVDGFELLDTAREADPDLAVIILTGYPSVKSAVEALKRGADEYLLKPVNPEELTTVVHRLLEARLLRREHSLLERRMQEPPGFEDMVGSSQAMWRVFDTIDRLSRSPVDVLIVGETGTGKELVARSIHRRSAAKGRFVPVDCGAIPEALMESELFGHERGAYTGADSTAIGLLEFANGGTLFLDELTSMPAVRQAKLLRVLQERAFRRVGGTQLIEVEVRVVAAANEDPETLVQAGKFREDLYHRLNVGRVEIPPLRDHREDVPLLLDHFLSRGERELSVSPDALEMLRSHTWPGNVRELENLVRRALVMADGPEIGVNDLPDSIVAGSEGGAARSKPDTFFEERARRIDTFETQYFRSLLATTRGDVSAAAETAGLPRGTLYRLLKKHGISPDDFRPDS
jgi:DNA-binding NtrC family response regulator